MGDWGSERDWGQGSKRVWPKGRLAGMSSRWGLTVANGLFCLTLDTSAHLCSSFSAAATSSR